MRPRRDAGFTLLEMLLAVTLLSMIMATIMGGLHLGKRAWETGRSYETVGEVEEAARAIAEQFAAAFPVALARPNAPPVASFQGAENGARFIAISDGGAQWGGLILTEVANVRKDRENNLVIWTRVFRPEEGLGAARAAMRETEALRDIAYFELSYYGVVDPAKPPQWTKNWKDLQTIPRLISARLGARRLGQIIDASFSAAPRQQ